MEAPSGPPAAKTGLTSVANALRILSLLTADAELRVVDVARSLGVAVSTAHRLLATMVEEGYLRQPPGSRRYLAGPEVIRLAREINAEQILRHAAEPHLHALCRELNETVNLQILAGSDVYFLASAEDRHQLRVAQQRGHRMPAHMSAGGKVLLSSLSSEALDAILPAKLQQSTRRSIGDRVTLAAELELIRSWRFASNMSESDESVHAVAVPVYDGGDQYIAALSVAAPTSRLPEWRVRHVVPILNKTSAKITANYTGDTPGHR